MRKPYKLIAACLLVAVGSLVWLALPRPEPVYEGQTLMSWLRVCEKTFTVPMDPRTPPTGEPQRAIRAIGTNALPRLVALALTEAKGARFGGWLLRMTGGRFPWTGNTRNYSRRLAWSGFEALGPEASAAVPALSNLLKSRDPERRWVAAVALGYIGPGARDAVPALINQLKDNDPRARSCAIWALGEIHQHADIVIPVLSELLETPVTYENVSREDLVLHALDALGKFGTQAASAVPMIERLSHESWSISLASSNALQRIKRDRLQH